MGVNFAAGALPFQIKRAFKFHAVCVRIDRFKPCNDTIGEERRQHERWH